MPPNDPQRDDSVTLTPDDIEMRPDGSFTVRQEVADEIRRLADSARARQRQASPPPTTGAVRVDI